MSQDQDYQIINLKLFVRIWINENSAIGSTHIPLYESSKQLTLRLPNFHQTWC